MRTSSHLLGFLICFIGLCTAQQPVAPADSADVNENLVAASEAASHQQWQTALRLVQQVIRQRPNHPTAWALLGQAYLHTGNLQMAETAYRKQIEVNPYTDFAYAGLGEVLMVSRRIDEAEVQFKKQIEVTPLHPQAHGVLGSIYIKSGNYAEAVSELETAEKISPEMANWKINLGIALLNLGKPGDAAAAFDRAIEESPEPIWELQAAEELIKHGGAPDKALGYTEAAAAKLSATVANLSVQDVTPNAKFQAGLLIRAWAGLADLYWRNGEEEKAEPFATAAWNYGQEYRAGNVLAEIAEKKNQKQKAAKLRSLAKVRAPLTKDEIPMDMSSATKKKMLEKSIRERDASLELQDIRTVKLGSTFKATGNGVFNVTVSQDGAVKEVYMVSGDESVRDLGTGLIKKQKQQPFPDIWPTVIRREAIFSCSKYIPGCMLIWNVGDRSYNFY